MSESSSANCVAVHQPLPVYLVHYNAPDWVRSACASIQLSDEPVELIVVNNSGGDLSLGPDVRVIESGGNLGYTGGANVALRDWLGGDADTCVVGSHDLHVARDALSQMKQVLADNPDVGIAGPTLNHEPSMPEPSPGVEDVAWVSGTCMMFRRTCIEQVGFFDERYRSYAEDFDICYRARKAGWRVVTGRSSVAHGLGTATGGQAARRIANSVLFDVKHYGRLGGYRTLGRIVVSVPQSVIMGRPRRALAHLAAIPQAVRHIVTFREPHGNGEGRPDVLTPGEKALDRGLEVIVVAYGSPEMLRRALEPVRELPITVVDNSSMPEIESLCDAELGCRYIDPGFNGGFAAGVNVGLARRQVPAGDVLLLNPDAEISVDVVRQLQDALLMDDKLASVGPRQVDESGKPIRVSWPFLSPLGRLARCSWPDETAAHRSSTSAGQSCCCEPKRSIRSGPSTTRSSCMRRKRTGPIVRTSSAGDTWWFRMRQPCMSVGARAATNRSARRTSTLPRSGSFASTTAPLAGKSRARGR